MTGRGNGRLQHRRGLILVPVVDKLNPEVCVVVNDVPLNHDAARPINEDPVAAVGTDGVPLNPVRPGQAGDVDAVPGVAGDGVTLDYGTIQLRVNPVAAVAGKIVADDGIAGPFGVQVDAVAAVAADAIVGDLIGRPNDADAIAGVLGNDVTRHFGLTRLQIYAGSVVADDVALDDVSGSVGVDRQAVAGEPVIFDPIGTAVVGIGEPDRRGKAGHAEALNDAPARL